jgi:hypothetical protein
LNNRVCGCSAALAALLLIAGCGLLDDNPQHIGYVTVEAVTASPDTVAAFGDTIAVTAAIDYFVSDSGELFSSYWEIEPADIDTFSRGDTLFIIAPAYQVRITATVRARISALSISSGSIGISVINLSAPQVLWTGVTNNRTYLQADSLLVFSIDARYQRTADSLGFTLVNQSGATVEDTVVPGRPLTHSLDLTALRGAYALYARAWARAVSGEMVMGADTVSFVVNAADILPKMRAAAR